MLPYTITNGTIPDADEVQGNFDYLAAGKGLMRDTLANIKTVAMAAPTVPFLAQPTDLKALLWYTGDATAGPEANGFITVASYETIS